MKFSFQDMNDRIQNKEQQIAYVHPYIEWISVNIYNDVGLNTFLGDQYRVRYALKDNLPKNHPVFNIKLGYLPLAHYIRKGNINYLKIKKSKTNIINNHSSIGCLFVEEKNTIEVIGYILRHKSKFWNNQIIITNRSLYEKSKSCILSALKDNEANKDIVFIDTSEDFIDNVEKFMTSNLQVVGEQAPRILIEGMAEKI